MRGMSRKRTAAPENVEATSASPQDLAEALPEALAESFRILEDATLSLDGIAHALGEARLIARIASRPEGAAQRGLVAARYAALKDEIEARAGAATFADSDRVLVLYGAE